MLLDGGSPLPPGLEPTNNFLAFMAEYLLIVSTVRFIITNWRR